jgi:hypothetical protein
VPGRQALWSTEVRVIAQRLTCGVAASSLAIVSIVVADDLNYLLEYLRLMNSLRPVEGGIALAAFASFLSQRHFPTVIE